MGNLKFEFYESGVGETILITFPSGELGIVDAHPSSHNHRPEILELVKGRKIRLVCLTHPHADHGVDLVPVLQKHADIAEFWHTIFDIPALIFGLEQCPNFPSQVRSYAAEMNKKWGEFLIDLFHAVVERDIPRHQLRSDIREVDIDNVKVYCLGPDESVHNSYFDAYHTRLTDPEKAVPDPNSLSAILAFNFGSAVVLLGADALKGNWESAVHHYRKQGLPKACLFKVPHHGARNALGLQKKTVNYLDICALHAKAVLFAGDSKHPDPTVFERLRQRTEVFCLANGRKGLGGANPDPLRLGIPGAVAIYPAPVCNPVISFEVDENARLTVLQGNGCGAACFPGP